ncbi:MAG: YdcF family protein [Candidatus Magasanikbacteria bacterium]|nr:YdcF family protein [Candidatus Magasanikbacteria bacterium]
MTVHIFLRKYLALMFTICFFASLFLFGFFLRSLTLYHPYTSHIYNSLESVPDSDVALVFGAGLKKDGSLTDALRDRVLTGIELYQTGKIEKLLMTGDNGRERYDEVTAMKKLAIKNGIPDEDVILDYAGFSTYQSCYRARDIFELNKYDVIVVSQKFHLSRILYMCNSLGVKSVGFVADKHIYRGSTWWSIREALAKFKGFLFVEIFKPLPKYLGERECIFSCS